MKKTMDKNKKISIKKRVKHYRAVLGRKIYLHRSSSRTAFLISMGRETVREVDFNSRQAVILQHRLLMKLLQKNKDTEFGKKYGFADIHSVEEYKDQVPFTTYEDYLPYIERMMEGEKNLLCVRKPMHYAITSGSVGKEKYIPVSKEELKKYMHYSVLMSFGVADEYYRNTTGKSVPAGPGLNAVEVQVINNESGVNLGVISGKVISAVKDYIPYLLSSPWEVICREEEMDMKYLKTRLALAYRDLAFMDSVFMTGLVDLMDYIRDNYEMLCKDIYHGRINKNVKVPKHIRESLERKILPDRARARDLMREFRQGFDTPIIPRIWPRMSWISGIGTGAFSSYARLMRKYTGKSIPFHNMCYAASESFMAVARHMGDESYVLLPDGGFYEFIPVRDEEGSRTFTIEELEIGEEYEIIVTNLSGFYRYRLYDVVRVTGYYNETPLLQFIYRKDQLLSINGEKTSGAAIRWAVERFSREAKIFITDYSVYPDTDSSPGFYVILMEPEKTVPKDYIPYCRDLMEACLMQANPTYGDMVRKGHLRPLEIVFLQQQTYQLYREVMIMRGASFNQLKPVDLIDTPFQKKFFFGLKEDYSEFDSDHNE